MSFVCMTFPLHTVHLCMQFCTPDKHTPYSYLSFTYTYYSLTHPLYYSLLVSSLHKHTLHPPYSLIHSHFISFHHPTYTRTRTYYILFLYTSYILPFLTHITPPLCFSLMLTLHSLILSFPHRHKHYSHPLILSLYLHTQSKDCSMEALGQIASASPSEPPCLSACGYNLFLCWAFQEIHPSGALSMLTKQNLTCSFPAKFLVPCNCLNLGSINVQAVKIKLDAKRPI